MIDDYTKQLKKELLLTLRKNDKIKCEVRKKRKYDSNTSFYLTGMQSPEIEISVDPHSIIAEEHLCGWSDPRDGKRLVYIACFEWGYPPIASLVDILSHVLTKYWRV